MRFPFINKRGQIRGVDFSLALIIFSLTMIQILILTNTFIDGNRSFITLEEREANADGLGDGILSSTGLYGTTSNWEVISTSQLQASSWSFGVSNNNGVDSFKLSRLSNWTISNWLLDYDTIQAGLQTTDDFKIEIISTLEITITSVNDDGNNVVIINGTISKSGKPLTDAIITGFAINSTQDIAQGADTSSVSGTFSVHAGFVNNLETNDYYSIVVFAEHGTTASDVSIGSYTRGTPATTLTPNNVGRVSLFNNTNLSVDDPYSLNVTAELPGVDSANVMALYPGTGPGQINYTSAGLSSVGSNLWYGDVRTPQQGNVVYLVQGFNGGDFDTIAYLNFPVTLDDEISNSLGPAQEPTQSSSTAFLSILVRGLVLEFLLTYWG